MNDKELIYGVILQKLLKLLELVGLQGDTTEGIKALSQGVDFDGLRSPFCAQVILNLTITIIVNQIGNAIATKCIVYDCI